MINDLSFKYTRVPQNFLTNNLEFSTLIPFYIGSWLVLYHVYPCRVTHGKAIDNSMTVTPIDEFSNLLFPQIKDIFEVLHLHYIMPPLPSIVAFDKALSMG